MTELVGSRVLCKCERRGEGLITNHEDHCSKGGNGLTLRHNMVCNTLVKCLQSAGVLVTPKFQAKEGSFSKSYVPDLEVTGLPKEHQEAFVEVTIISPFQKQRVGPASQWKLSAARYKENVKKTKYADLLAKQTGKSLYVAAMETTGAFGGGLNQLLNATSAIADPILCHRHLAPQWNWTSNSFKRYWRQRLAIAFWSGSFTHAEALIKCGGSQGIAVRKGARGPFEWPIICDHRRGRSNSPASSGAETDCSNQRA